MLKALELVGFKSFADRTRFDFPDGITVVVGPNGSGKSNVVDAVKWVLGAQSAKALRGADMADCIFKGSAEGGRKPANSAEVVLILDNSTQLFGNRGDEVHVSRRVFRSGEGEYAINNQPCRLKDVRDLFRGTGVGVDAYSLIEQGKVDRLLQASAKDRRGIFEEAAGISRFKAKKVEAERRLVRVDQNLLRLGDIVDEVGKRLTTLKNQATKAQRYRELSGQLTEKRTLLGQIDLFSLQNETAQAKQRLQKAFNNQEELTQRLESLTTQSSQEQKALLDLKSQHDFVQQEFLEAQRALISAESGHSSSSARIAELLGEKTVLLERIELLEQRATVSSEEIENRKEQLAQLGTQREQSATLLQTLETEHAAAREQLQTLRDAFEIKQRDRNRIRDEISKHNSQLAALEMHREQLIESIDRQRAVAVQLEKDLADVQSEIATALSVRDAALTASNAANLAKEHAQELLRSEQNQLREGQEHLVTLQGRLHGVRERLNVLVQLEDQFTGAGRGGQQLLRLAREQQQSYDDNTPSLTPPSRTHAWNTVRGLVADLLTTELHLAPLIDVALGTLSDAIVLTDGQILEWINDGSLSIDGRVTLLRLDRLMTRRTGEKIQLDGLRGVLGRADRLTKYDEDYEPLIRFLLGTTWFVDTLSTALELSHFRGAGLRFVTAECQLVDIDGSITLGSLQTGLGLVSRRSEMQSAREQITHAEEMVAAGATALAMNQQRVAAAESELRKRETESHIATRELTTCELRLESLQMRLEKTQSSHHASIAALSGIEAKSSELETSFQNTTAAVAQCKDREASLQSQLDELANDVSDVESLVRDKQSSVTEHRIELARLEQRTEGMRMTLDQLVHDSTERAKSLEVAVTALDSIAAKIEHATAASADFQQKIEHAQQTIQSIEERQSLVQQQLENQQSVVEQSVRQADASKRNLEKNQDLIESIEQQLSQSQAQQEQLLAHYLSEYQIDLAAIEQPDALESSSVSDSGEADSNSDGATDSESETPAIESESHDLDASEDSTRETRASSRKRKQSKASADLGSIDRNEVESQITYLRHEIAAAGSVNMEALAELDDLQSRYDRLSGHQTDLVTAKTSLIETMAQIDADSQHLFMETLQAIRANFQTLYRKSFGGGFADIILENENDPDSGIEIIATPPGKTTLSNSLLSGGEKALTAVALIMAFFQYRPSPFCILDEVDAPFDEANIGRFVTVLNEFLSSTKFIVVTHSKKTMTAANMIYGITMQESGVSRQVSVKFEDVNDKGEIVAPVKATGARRVA